MDTFFIIAGFVTGCVIWIAAQAAQTRIHPERLLKRLARNAARKILKTSYWSEFGPHLNDEINSLARTWGLAPLSTPTLGLEEKIHWLEKFAEVMTDHELSDLFARGYGHTRLLPIMTKLYATGRLSYSRGRDFHTLTHNKDKPIDGLREFCQIVWEMTR